MTVFRSSFGEAIFNHKYRHEGCETWEKLAAVVVEDVCGKLLPRETCQALFEAVRDMKFIPGGRYLYYAGRSRRFWNNCFLLKAEEDTREDWASLSQRTEAALMTGGGIGVDYSIYRPKNSPLKSTGGIASGPVPKMKMINEIGRYVIQGGARRSAIYASLNWQHGDVNEFLTSKNWYDMPIAGSKITVGDAKEADLNYPAVLDMTNISLNYDNAWLLNPLRATHPTFVANVRQALKTGEPGFSFNFWNQENETLRNPCCEVVSEDDSDVCCLGSVNISRVDNLSEFAQLVELGTLFLLCGTLGSEVPYEKCAATRTKNRRLGLGLMGIHEWLLKRGYKYECPAELKTWLTAYQGVSRKAATDAARSLSCTIPVACRAIAPTGTIGILAGTTTGIEPLFAVAYKRRYLKEAQKWHYQYVVDSTAEIMIREYGLDPEKIETSRDLTAEQRIAFQADIQDFVDMSISSTINLPKWGSRLNNEDTVPYFAETLAKYAPRLRGFTCYPDGSRGGQPLVTVSYSEAHGKTGEEFMEVAHDVCDLRGGGVCGS